MITDSGFLDGLVGPGILNAVWMTIWISLVAQAIAVVIGLILGPMRGSNVVPLRAISWFYVWFFRGSPELMQIIAWYAILPLVGVNLSVIQAGLLGLSVNEGARMAEIVRGAITSVPGGQYDAALVLGMNRLTAFRLIILPQAARLIISPLGNEMNLMFKTSSLVSVIGIVELLRHTQLITQTTSRPLAVYLATALIYLAITTMWGGVQRAIESRLANNRGHLDQEYRRRRFSLDDWFPLVGQNL